MVALNHLVVKTKEAGRNVTKIFAGIVSVNILHVIFRSKVTSRYLSNKIQIYAIGGDEQIHAKERVQR
jgi:hypothetical protein